MWAMIGSQRTMRRIKEGVKRKEVDLPKGCSDGKWPWIVKLPAGAGGGGRDIKKYK